MSSGNFFCSLATSKAFFINSSVQTECFFTCLVSFLSDLSDEPVEGSPNFGSSTAPLSTSSIVVQEVRGTKFLASSRSTVFVSSTYSFTSVSPIVANTPSGVLLNLSFCSPSSKIFNMFDMWTVGSSRVSSRLGLVNFDIFFCRCLLTGALLLEEKAGVEDEWKVEESSLVDGIRSIAPSRVSQHSSREADTKSSDFISVVLDLKFSIIIVAWRTCLSGSGTSMIALTVFTLLTCRWIGKEWRLGSRTLKYSISIVGVVAQLWMSSHPRILAISPIPRIIVRTHSSNTSQRIINSTSCPRSLVAVDRTFIHPSLFIGVLLAA